MQLNPYFARAARLQFTDALLAFGDLLLRLYLSKVFFQAGLSKLRDWDATISLFSDEYQVALLSPEVAAVLGTGAELLLPILLITGLFRKYAAIGLSLLNIIALISYYQVLQDMPAALQDHLEWGLMLFILIGMAPTYLCLDHYLFKRHIDTKY